MAEIRFSIYGDQVSCLEEPAFFARHTAQYPVDVRVERMTWEAAWPKLLDYALRGGGPHISQIGSIWTSTLVAMDALRPFTTHEINSLGGVHAFFASTWQNTMTVGHSEKWAIPFTGFTYLVLYRRDLLQQAGVAEEAAFATPEAMFDTLDRLRAAGISAPLLLPAGRPFRARVHVAASWVWGAGGDYMSGDGRQALFDQPAARAGLGAFFKLYRYLAPADHGLSMSECLDRFAAGQAAVALTSSSVSNVMRAWRDPLVLNNLGAALLPGVPWVGGSNLVVWRETRMSPEQERSALRLAGFLAGVPAQTRYAQAHGTIPARVQVLSQVDFGLAVLNHVFEQAMRTGRAYHPVPVWVRVMNELSRALDAVTADVLAGADIAAVTSQHLSPLAQRFNLMLSG